MLPLGRWLILAGVLLVLIGAVLTLAPQIPWLGRLPGDVRIERAGLRIYFPITTCLVVSLVLSLILQLLSRLR